jgi:hypothetical protein
MACIIYFMLRDSVILFYGQDKKAWPATNTHGRILARVLRAEAAGMARCPPTD